MNSKDNIHQTGMTNPQQQGYSNNPPPDIPQQPMPNAGGQIPYPSHPTQFTQGTGGVPPHFGQYPSPPYGYYSPMGYPTPPPPATQQQFSNFYGTPYPQWPAQGGYPHGYPNQMQNPPPLVSGPPPLMAPPGGYPTQIPNTPPPVSDEMSAPTRHTGGYNNQMSNVPPPVSGAPPPMMYPGGYPNQISNVPPPVSGAPPSMVYSGGYHSVAPSPMYPYPPNTPYYMQSVHHTPYPQPYSQGIGNTQESSNTPPATNTSYTTASEPPREESESDRETQREESIGQQEQSMHNVNPDAQSMVPSAQLVVNQQSDPVVKSYSSSSKNDLDPSMSMNDVPETDGGEQLESTQETNNASFEESSMSSYPLSSNMTQETGRSFSRDNQQEEILINSFVNDLRKQLEALSKEDLFEVVQNALSRLGLHECIDALVEECGMDAVTNAASKTGNDVMKF
eukprot:g5615.t1